MAERSEDDQTAQGAWATLLQADDLVAALRVDRAGRLLGANAEARALFGGVVPADLAHALVPTHARLTDVLAAEGPWRGHGTLLRGDDQPIAVRLVVVPAGEALAIGLLADFQAFVQLQASLSDINSDLTNLMRDRAKQAAALRAANERLLEQDKLKTRFYASMNHELRTPLNSILGFAEDALDGLAGPLTPELRTYFATIQNSGQRQLALVTDILDLAKLQAGRMTLEATDVPLAEALADLAALMRPLVARKGQDLALDVAPGLAVRADPEKLHQILLNLVGNAHKYTPEGGRIAVVADRDGAMVRLRVQDTGIGVPAADVPHLFEEFHQVRRGRMGRAPGTGLGLAITKSLVDLHGGRITVASEPGVGTTFTLLLPPASGDQAAKAPGGAC